MTTKFTITSSFVVTDSNYTWDAGAPEFTVGSTNTTTTQYTTDTDTITGFAPGVKVVFKNLSKVDSLFDLNQFTWNFGDYYNTTSNIITLNVNTQNPTDCRVPEIEHTFVMPGEYNVSLTYQKTKVNRTIDPNADLCRGKYNIRWYWDELACELADSKTWDEVKCTGTYPKKWLSETACLQKYCKVWAWVDTKLNGVNEITWAETKTGGKYEKLWRFEQNTTVCNVADIDVQTTGEITEQIYTRVGVIKVLEIPPIATLQCLTRPITGNSPHTVTISPNCTRIGSFSLDRIIWDMGDGTPLKTVSRHATPDQNLFTFNNTFSSDPSDPRNYDITHTYIRTRDMHSMFYPSITCYATNTDTFDSCSIPVGPITFKRVTADEQPTLLKVRNTLKGLLYNISVDNTVGSFTTNKHAVSSTIQNTPKNITRDSYNSPYFLPIGSGNTGVNYPNDIIPTCPNIPVDLVE